MSKQFFFVVNLQQPIPNAFQDLATSLKTIIHLKKCVVVVPYLDFRGQQHSEDLVIYDIEDKSNNIARANDRAAFNTVARQVFMGAAGCIGKIPIAVKKEFPRFDKVLKFLP